MNKLPNHKTAHQEGARQEGAGQEAAARRLAVLLDDAFRIPGTSIRFGWDSIIGLVPGLGDVATTILALVPVATAWKLGASRWLLARMLMNVAMDGFLGSVPIVGDAFDLFYRANRRNVALLDKIKRDGKIKRKAESTKAPHFGATQSLVAAPGGTGERHR